jgi:hypothetical protein
MERRFASIIFDVKRIRDRVALVDIVSEPEPTCLLVPLLEGSSLGPEMHLKELDHAQPIISIGGSSIARVST